MDKNDWRSLLESGIALLREDQPQQALARMRRAERLAPQERDVLYWLANTYRMTGDTHRAVGLFRQLLAANPGDFDTSFALSFLLRDAGKPGEAAEALTNASEQAGVTTHQLLQITGFLRDSNQHVAAIQVLQKVVGLNPGEAELHFKLARLYQATGEFEPALQSLRKTLDLQPSIGPAWTVLAQQKRFSTADDPDYMRMQTAAGQSHGGEADMCIRFALGKALDDLQQWPAAWERYQEGNRLMSRATPWDRRAWDTFVDRSIASTGRAPALAPATGRNAVFIVGMPRSGTTLLEQILDRHPALCGRGELGFLSHFAGQSSAWGRIDALQRNEMADTLWTQMRLEGPEDGIYIDKNPLNFRFLEIVFELLPTAKVLHVSRDGRDSCLSCFFQLFQHADTAFSYTLEHLSGFYSGYRRLMAHWEKVYASRILRVRYEDLVSSNDDTIADILRYLGVDWHDAVTQSGQQEKVIRTASVWQARQPVHSLSVGRWRRYADCAPDFFARLAEIDAQFDLGTPA